MLARKNSFSTSFSPIFTPPFNGLWLVMLIYYICCYAMYPDIDIKRGKLPDPDDYMYLAQINDWLNGQSWYDNVQHRMNPPQGVIIPFSRLAQIPIALLIVPFRWFGMNFVSAGTVAASIEPIVLLAFEFLALRDLARFFVPRRWAGASSFVAIFALGLLDVFRPGHVDHHGLIALLTTLALVQACKLLRDPASSRAALWAGLILSLAMTVALEILPWLLLMGAWLGIAAVAQGGRLARSNLVFATAFLGGSVVGLLLTRPPQEFFDLDILVYSFVYVLLALGLWFAYALVALAANARLEFRFLTGIFAASLSSGLFLGRFPQLIAGPYGALDPELRDIILEQNHEATPIVALPHPWDALIYLLPAVLVIPITGYMIYRTHGYRFWLWGLMGVLYVSATFLALFFQYRCATTMSMLEVMPLTVLLHRGWLLIQRYYRDRKRVYAELFLVMLVGPLLVVLLPGVVDGRRFNYGVLMFIAQQAADPCDQYDLTKVLNLEEFSDRPRLILADIDQGPEILFRTPHQVLAATFHMNVSGNYDVFRFFSTPYLQEAENIVRRRKVDLIVACTTYSDTYVVKTPDAKIISDKSGGAPLHMIETLMMQTPPPWLEPVEYESLKNFVVYKVLPSGTFNVVPMPRGQR
jgi:hypothetical protein